jgi:hypothetical protein
MARQFLTDIELGDQRELRFEDADSSHYVGFKSPATVTTNRIWTLPAADGTSSQVLSTNGSGVLSWATSGGGGGLTHFAESESTASPNATVPVDALTATDASYTNIDVALVTKGSGATLAQVPDATATGGDKRGTNATDWQKVRSSATQVASGSRSTISGGANNTASGSRAAVVGGDSNTASSTYAFVGCGQSNSASIAHSFVGGGQSNTASTSSHATVCGGSTNTASGQYSFVGGGQSNTASGSWCGSLSGITNVASGTYSAIAGGSSNVAFASNSFVGGGDNNRANGISSCISGGANGTARLVVGYHVFPACNGPIATTQGCTQSALLLLGRQTTDATATVLASNSSAAATTNQVTLPNNSAYSFSGEVIAGVTGAGDSARWTIDGAIKRGANAASTAMIGTPTVVMTHFDAGAATWVVAVTADTTNGGIKVEVTGAAATTIRWVCKINTTEMTY